MAVSQAFDAPPRPQLVPLAAGPPPARRRLGGFLVPDHPFLVHAPCPACRGPVFYEDGDARCLLCARSLTIVALTASGRVSELAERGAPSPPSVRVQPGQARRTSRRLSKLDGLVGLCARVFKLVPRGPDQYVVVESLAVALSAHRDDIRSALRELERQHLIESFIFASGYRTGWRRVARGSP